MLILSVALVLFVNVLFVPDRGTVNMAKTIPV